MTEAQQIRAEIMMQLYAQRPLHASAALMARTCRQWGQGWSATQIEREAAFLVGQGLAEKTTDPATGEAKYAVTSAGVIQHELAQRGE